MPSADKSEITVIVSEEPVPLSVIFAVAVVLEPLVRFRFPKSAEDRLNVQETTTESDSVSVEGRVPP